MAIFVAVVIAGATRTPAFLIIAAGLLVAWGLVEITARIALESVEVRLDVTPKRLLAGETVVATLSVTNRKPIHLAWLELRLTLPDGIVPAEDDRVIPRTNVGAVVALSGHERLVLRFPLTVKARGPYTIGPVLLRSSDWLGFITDDRTAAAYAEVVAYPQPLPLTDRHRPSFRPLAEAPVRRGLVPDPLRFRGVREHQRGDPRKEIHWKASARLGRLQTKQYEPAASLDAVFLVNVASFEQYWVIADPEAVETVIAATAELIRIAADAGRQVGLITNGLDELTHERPRSALGRGPRPIRRSLDILARLGPYAASAPETVFLRERGRLPWGATLVCVTPVITPLLAASLITLRRGQHRVLAVTVNEAPAPLAARLAAADVQLDTLSRRERRAAV